MIHSRRDPLSQKEIIFAHVQTAEMRVQLNTRRIG